MQIKKVLTNSFLSLSTLVLTTPIALAQSSFEFPDKIKQSTTLNIMDVIAAIGGWMLTIAGALGVIYLVYGGIVYIVGGSKGAEEGKQIVINAIIGLVIVALSYAIASFVLTQIGKIN